MKANIIPIDGKVINSDWRDDVDYETYGTDEQEMEYISPAKVSKTSIEKIKNIDLRPRLRGRGYMTNSVLKNEKLAA
ncbi:MAG: hypothetical protein Q4F56_02885 [Candidatus Saccharibacteria bacterium]|nr:hypothetical protein [Candidatus Saccharibacteria bacterium]